MTLNQFIESRIIAINANFASRNTKVCSVRRMTQIKAMRRCTIRRLIAEYRLATSPWSAPFIEDRVKWMTE
ncbi:MULTISPECIES: hypothetical protein [Vibrio]|uniref:hypothetical protein n=1 Tax=Vibrio TaxID=662 RepID=UPI00078E3411|nr:MULTISPECIES: hypothetical protein [Vibrio]BAU70897.1 hypothetical protein [Vibrio sp. 04Ya108]BBM67846.1 hypothetical protein VA249_44920 [Vibrio alfacsensis]BCN27016.1 hypothetical protein VYA_42080 [Vibrio alfacsensis]